MTQWVSSSEIRAKFSKMMSEMYQKEVPLYGDLLELVDNINQSVLSNNDAIHIQLKHTGELNRLSQERHGAIRLGTIEELNNMRRILAVMGMYPVGYYDLVPAGVPVHSTAFRAIEVDDLNQSPFRIFTSLLRVELIDDKELRDLAEQILSRRQIFTNQALALTEKFEQQGGLNIADAEKFLTEVIETFRWHTHAPVSKDLYMALDNQHRLIADVVAFKGPHINHLTPRTLDIDQIQNKMLECGITPKAVIEGPPRRKCPILLRQTSFKALLEKVKFTDHEGGHTARFGEIEQRGVALTPKGRKLYDELLIVAQQRLGKRPDEENAFQYMRILEETFQVFPDDYRELALQGLAYFYYFAKPDSENGVWTYSDLNTLICSGKVEIEPIVYEDFLPVSAAGIFQSNLGNNENIKFSSKSNREIFEEGLGVKIFDEMQLYAELQSRSIDICLETLNKKNISMV